MATEVLTYVYTSRTEMARLYSEVAVQLREDDDDDGVAESGVIQDCIDEATDMINIYCLDWHEAADMADNLTVRRWATLIACWLLSQRRGNPEQFAGRYEQIVALLEKCLTGHYHIPRLATKKDFTPGVSQYVVDDRFKIRKLRVTEQISTGGGTPEKRHTDRRWIYEEVWP